jgi:hypothetical protein
MILPRRLRVAPLLLVLLLIAGPLAAAVHRPQEWQPRLSFNGLVSEAWAFVMRIWGKAGGSSDPFGNPAPNSQPPSNSTSTDPASGK